ncbi:MAG: SDR family oxidoreductase, partial [Muribaculaceae bacterium]|nr:SDR family oxidoreductase [Muribaculaceae bacterium]
MAKKILVVGAGGFAGGFLVDEALRRGGEVWAGVRESTSRRYLTDPRIKFLTLDFDNPESLAASLEDALPQGEKWDWIVYN